MGINVAIWKSPECPIYYIYQFIKKTNYILEMQLYECSVYFNAKTDLGTSESYGPICWLYIDYILDLEFASE